MILSRHTILSHWTCTIVLSIDMLTEEFSEEAGLEISKLDGDLFHTPPLTRGNSAVSAYEGQLQGIDGELAS